MHLRGILGFLRFLAKNRNLIGELTKKEFQAKYLGSYLGVIWVIVQPVVTVFIFWFLFAIGFRIRPVAGDFPYILWMISGIVPWFFISDGTISGAGAILDNSFLIKKVAFRISVLPLVRVLAALLVNLILIVIMLLMFVLYGYPIRIYSLQIIYYLAAGVILVASVSLITATMTVFIKDVRQVVTIFMQFCFWLTAVFWPINILPAKYHFLIRLNPFSYIIEGFRDSLIHHQWFWQSHWLQTIYFWGLTLMIVWLGTTIYQKMRPSFADYT